MNSDVSSRKRTSCRAATTIAALWVLSVLVSLPPMVWRSHGGEGEGGVMACLMEHDHVAFAVYSTFGAFYIPLTLILVLYYKIYRAAVTLRNRHSSSRLAQHMVSSIILPGTPGLAERDGHAPPLSPDTLSSPTEKSFSEPSMEGDSVRITAQRRRSLRGYTHPGAKEQRAALTLGLILGAFVVCWLPFFLKEVIVNTCPSCSASATLADVLTWLGYLNSLINPLIYTIFNEDFKKAFLKLLPLRCGHYM